MKKTVSKTKTGVESVARDLNLWKLHLLNLDQALESLYSHSTLLDKMIDKTNHAMSDYRVCSSDESRRLAAAQVYLTLQDESNTLLTNLTECACRARALAKTLRQYSRQPKCGGEKPNCNQTVLSVAYKLAADKAFPKVSTAEARIAQFETALRKLSKFVVFGPNPR